MAKVSSFPARIKNIPDSNINIKLNDEPIPWQTHYKYPGILLDYKLSWCKDITETSGGAHSRLLWSYFGLEWSPGN